MPYVVYRRSEKQKVSPPNYLLRCQAVIVLTPSYISVQSLAVMADENAENETGSDTQITFSVKSTSDHKHVITVPETITVLALKELLSTPQYADVPPERQRLIYSGRVLKDPDLLSTYKIKDGNTVHMVKSAASNQRQSPANQSSSTTEGSSTNSGIPGVPSNLATGTGTDPLAGLTGARYAGFAQMPGAETFGPDGVSITITHPFRILTLSDGPSRWTG